MSATERQFWNAYYRRNLTDSYPSPDPLLFEVVPPLFEMRPYRALDVACGLGQNALWLAGQGYITDALDISDIALTIGQAYASRRGIGRMQFIQADLDEYPLEQNEYDIVVVMRFIKRGLIPDLRAAVRPGGRLIYEAYNLHALAQHPDLDPEQTFCIGELLGYFADWRILYQTTTNGVSRLVALKPTN